MEQWTDCGPQTKHWDTRNDNLSICYLGQLIDCWTLILNIFHCRSVAQDELNAADQEKMIGIAILSFISLVTLVFYFFVKNALSVIRVKDEKIQIESISWKTTKILGFCQRGDGKGQGVGCRKNEDRESLSWFSSNISCSGHETEQSKKNIFQFWT